MKQEDITNKVCPLRMLALESDWENVRNLDGAEDNIEILTCLGEVCVAYPLCSALQSVGEHGLGAVLTRLVNP